MTALPPSPFLTDSVAQPHAAGPAAVSLDAEMREAAADILESSTSTGGHQETPVVNEGSRAAGVTDVFGSDISDVGEIFYHARKLCVVTSPEAFDPRAITELDEILYSTLWAKDVPGTRSRFRLDVPAFMEALEPPPLFLQFEKIS